ncbi:hypothetical protein I4U23_028333 [Adineta vaga]|nr:hypothetical protein I4U23_028333 [Adineta vaga]
MNPQENPPNESYDPYHSFGSNPPVWQDSTQSQQPRFRGHSHYQGPYPTSNPRMRAQGDFQQRPRYPYNKRGGGGGYRQQNRDSNFNQQEQSFDNNEYPPTTTNYSNRNFKGFFRANMLEDPWMNMKPIKVPTNGTTLVFDTPNQ